LRGQIDPRDVGPMGREILDSLKTVQQGTWVELQAKASAEAAAK